MSETGKSKRDQLIESIAKRLRPVCTTMPLAEFDEMVERLADIELKYADRTSGSHGSRRDFDVD